MSGNHRLAQGRCMKLAEGLKNSMGLDRAIAYTIVARILSIIGSAGTVLLIVHFMGRIEQGYYYVLLSLISLRTVFELGATFVIIQMAAHECAHLTLHADGNIGGDPIARERLASLLQKTVRWFSLVGISMAGILLPGGWFFLADRHSSGMQIHWHWPWILAVMATSCLLVLDSVIFFLEGCGQIRQVAQMRVGQAIAGALLAWTFLALRHGLFAPGIVSLAYCGVGAGFLWRRRRLLGTLLHRPNGEHSISWRAEVWPFQWRIGVSTLCVYFTAQIFTPIVFATRGAIEAGQIGMSMSIAGYLGSIALAWMSTKVPTFGGLVASRDFERLDRLFFRTLRQSLPLLAALAMGCEGGIILLRHLLPHVASRMVDPAIFALLLVTVLSSFVVQSEGMYLRSFKCEPFLVQSMIVSGITVAACLLLARPWGNMGIAVSYLAGTGVVGLISGTAIFHSWRKNGMRQRTPNPVAI